MAMVTYPTLSQSLWPGRINALTGQFYAFSLHLRSVSWNQHASPTKIGSFQVAQMVKNLPTMQETQVWSKKDPQENGMQPTLVFLPGESHGQRSQVGYSPWGRRESDKTEWLTLSLSFQKERSVMERGWGRQEGYLYLYLYLYMYI